MRPFFIWVKDPHGGNSLKENRPGSVSSHLPGDEGFPNAEIVIEYGDVRMEAGFQFSETFEAQGLGLIP
jgi:hypothetical protein